MKLHNHNQYDNDSLIPKTPNPITILKRFFSNRLVVLFLAIALSFSFLTLHLFDLQIVQGQDFYDSIVYRAIRNVRLAPERGNIYDRFGRPLAINVPTRSVMLDPSVNLTTNEANIVIYELVMLLQSNGETPSDILPITLSPPFEFTFAGDHARAARARFFNEVEINDTRIYDDYDNVIYQGYTAQDVLQLLINRFDLTPLIEEHNISETQLRSLLSLRTSLWNHRWQRYVPVTIAIDVGLDTITSIEEDPTTFSSAFISTEFLRYYPAGHYVSHIVGTIGTIRDTHDIEALIEERYLLTDQIGHSGIELAFERELRGLPGQEIIYVNDFNRRLYARDGSRNEAVDGSNIFLTLDLYLQQEAFHILQNTLAETLINRIIRPHHSEAPITVHDLLSSLVAANNIDARQIFEIDAGEASLSVANFVRNYYAQAYEEAWAMAYAQVAASYNELEVTPPQIRSQPNYQTIAGRIEINEIIANAIGERRISPNQILLIMYEQGIITGPNLFNRISSGGAFIAQTIVVEMLREGQITPQMTNLDPSTGSLVVVDVHTGEVLASVNYPSFDNNQLVNNINNEYFTRLNHLDPTTPLLNRAFMERRAPGSTFKMVTAIAGLEYGVITPTTRIIDQVRFTRAGLPYATSWSSFSLGSLNVAEAIAISSNYFFYETSFRLGQAAAGGEAAFVSIERLNTYMRAFGFDSLTGVEIGESWRHGAPSQMSSRALREHIFAPQGGRTRWTNGDTIRTAIGQDLNAYTSATMARFTAGLATRGDMVYLRLLDRIVSEDEVYHARTIPFYTDVDISDSTWNVVHEGMRMVSEINHATATGLFNNFPFSVASKTGTAQESAVRLSHTTFNAFAPLNDPQVAIHVTIPFGATATTSPSPSSLIARDVLAAYFQLNNNTEETVEVLLR